jgi:hypothetical protein
MIPLSFTQRRLGFIAQLNGPSTAYNIPMLMRLTGDVDVPALSAASRDMLGRHEVLRTMFPTTDGEPYQHIVDLEDLDWQLQLVDVSPRHLDNALDRAVQSTFDISTEVPVRAWLSSTGPDEHVLATVIHRIASDEWSLSLLARDLSQAYEARRAGRPSAWEPLPVQYADFTLWQRDLLGDESDPGSVPARQIAYWREALAGVPDELVLPADHPPSRAHGTVPGTKSSMPHRRATSVCTAVQSTAKRSVPHERAG